MGVSVGQNHTKFRLVSIRHTRPNGETVLLPFLDTDADETLVFKTGVLVVMACGGEAHIMRIALERPVGAQLHTAEGFPAHQILRELERTVLDQLGIQAAVCAEVNILKKKPYIVGCTWAPTLSVFSIKLLVAAVAEAAMARAATMQLIFFMDY